MKLIQSKIAVIAVYVNQKNMHWNEPLFESLVSFFIKYLRWIEWLLHALHDFRDQLKKYLSNQNFISINYFSIDKLLWSFFCQIITYLSDRTINLPTQKIGFHVNFGVRSTVLYFCYFKDSLHLHIFCSSPSQFC